MKLFFTRMLFMLAVVAALGESAARAEFVDFSYAWSIQPGAVLPGGTGSVQIALSPNASANYELGAASPTLIPGATITTTSSAASGTPDSFNNPFSLKLSLTDTTSGATGNLTFSGTVSGTLTSTTSSLTSTFNNPLTQTLTLGSHIYGVTIDPSILGLPHPGADSNALLDALVRVTNVNGGTGGGGTPPGGPENAPEPSSLVLGGLAIAGLAARRWSRLKKQAV